MTGRMRQASQTFDAATRLRGRRECLLPVGLSEPDICRHEHIVRWAYPLFAFRVPRGATESTAFSLLAFGRNRSVSTAGFLVAMADGMRAGLDAPADGV